MESDQNSKILIQKVSNLNSVCKTKHKEYSSIDNYDIVLFINYLY